MKRGQILVPLSVLLLAACGTSNGENTGAATENTSGVLGAGEPEPMTDTQQSVSPAPVDTAAGTTTAP